MRLAEAIGVSQPTAWLMDHALRLLVARQNQLGGTIEVKNKGGTVRVTMAKWDDPVDVEGPAEVVYSGIFTLPKDAWRS